jgi:hypothetical protein
MNTYEVESEHQYYGTVRADSKSQARNIVATELQYESYEHFLGDLQEELTVREVADSQPKSGWVL